MNKFENAGPITAVGEVVEQQEISEFFIGTCLLAAFALVTISVLLQLFFGIRFERAFYPGLIVLSLLVGVIGTVLAIYVSSPAIYVPYLRLDSTAYRTVLRSPEPVTEDEYEYHVILPTENQDIVTRYSGLGDSRQNIHLTNVRSQEWSQIEFDSENFVEISNDVFIEDITV